MGVLRWFAAGTVEALGPLPLVARRVVIVLLVGLGLPWLLALTR